jgi:hypothetical protein
VIERENGEQEFVDYDPDLCTKTAVSKPLFDAHPPARAQEWMPMESAPKDGTHFLGWREDIGHYEVWHNKRCACWHGPHGILSDWYMPTHWKPLDPPPTGSQNTGGA